MTDKLLSLINSGEVDPNLGHYLLTLLNEGKLCSNKIPPFLYPKLYIEEELVYKTPTDYIVWDTDFFITIPDNPRQRDTEERAKKAKHLHKPHIMHKDVEVFRLPDGSFVKGGGHTRSFLWEKGVLTKPKYVGVKVYDIVDEEEARELYKAIDSSKAAETAVDKVFSACHEAFGSKPKSNFFKKGGVKSAIELVYNNNSSLSDDALYNLPKTNPQAFKELKIIDDFGFKSIHFSDPIVLSACLLTIKRDGKKSLKFWKNLDNNLGTKDTTGVDGVEMVTQYLRDIAVFSNIAGEKPTDILPRNRGARLYYVGRVLKYYQGFFSNQKFNPKLSKNGWMIRK